MNVKFFLILMFTSISIVGLKAQELYMSPEISLQHLPLHKITSPLCQKTVIFDSLFYSPYDPSYILGIGDLAFTPNGAIYAACTRVIINTFEAIGEISKVNANGLVTPFYTDSVYVYPGLVADASGIIYSTGVNVNNSIDNILLRYNTNTNLYTKDTLPGGLRTAGDLTFYNENLYVCCLNGEIWHVDLQSPIQSNLVSIAHNQNGEILNLIGIIATKITCDSTLVVGNLVSSTPNGDGQTNFYQINLFTGLSTYICSAENAYGGMASPQEFAPPPEATTQYDSLSVCMGAEVMYANTPHIITHDTTLCTTYTSALGCDSTRCLRLMVSPSVTLNQDIMHCKGDVYNFENLSLTRDTNICRSYITATGCDSTYCLHLTFRDTSSVQLIQQICEGDSYTFEGQSYSSDTLVCRTYQNALCCDSTRCLRLSLMPIATFNQNELHCKGDVYNFENLLLTRDTSICRTYTSATGCDSTYCLNLTFQDTASQLVIQQICEGDSYTFEGQSYSSDTLVCRTYQNALGCDSTRCLRLTVRYDVTLSQDVAHCKGDVYNFENISLTRDTNICRSYITATGCDSTYCLHLTFRDTSSVQETQKICEGDSYTYEGQSYSSDTLVCRTYQNVLGCDSTRCLNLQVERLTAVGYPQDTILNLGETLRLWVQANATDYTAQWLPASGLTCDTCFAQTVQPVGSSIYEVVLTSSAGCTKVLQFRVEVRENYVIFAPTAFSPNKDGSNDIFKIFVGSSVSEVRSLRIYNRWGDEVYVGEHLTGSEGWNGTWLGKELEQAVYVWWAELVLVNGNVKTISGDVTLLR